MKKSLKFALPALLLSAGVLAYAAGEVTLANKAILDWEKFVENVNNPPQVEGTLAADDSAVTGKASAEAALEAAKTALSTAKSNLEAAEKTKEEMDDAETKAQTALENAQSDVTAAESVKTEADNAATTAKNTYETNNKNLSQWQAQRTNLMEDRTTKQNEIDECNASIKTYQDQIDAKTSEKSAKEATIASNKTTIEANKATIAANETSISEKQAQQELLKTEKQNAVVTKKVVAPWLEEDYNKVIAFQSAIASYYKWIDDNYDEESQSIKEGAEYTEPLQDIYVYFKVTTVGSTRRAALRLSFSNFDGATKCDQTDFDAFISDVDASKATTFTTTFYYGPQSNGISETISGITKFNYTESALSAVATQLESNIRDLKYFIEGGTEPDSEKQAEIQDQIDALGTEISGLESTNTSLGTDNTKLESDNATLEKAISYKDPDSGVMSGLTAEISALTAEKAPFDTQLTTLKGELITINSTISTLTANIKKLTDPTTEIDPKTGEVYKNADGTTMTGLDVLLEKQHRAEAAAAAAATAVTTAQKAESAAQTALSNAKADATAAETRVTNLTSSVNTAETNQSTAQTSYNTALAAYNAAQTAANAKATADAFEPYKNVTLNGNVTATTTINSYSGTINGGGYIIDVPKGSYLFDTFSGRMSNVAINGTTVNHNDGARFTNVVRWDGTTGKTYDADGAGVDYTGAKAFGAFGFAIRDNKNFGVSFNDGKIVAAAAAPSKVYDITVNDYSIDFNSKRNTQYYVQQVGGNLINIAKDTVTIPDNRFAKSATDDLSGVDNVYYTDGESNLCDNVVIKDKVDFYAPVQIDATSVKYDRTFKSNEDVALRFSAVCLPFALASGDDYDVFKFEKVENKKFWFTQTNSVAANKPALIRLKNATALEGLDLGETVIAQTTAQIVTFDGASNSPSISYGTFKSVKAGEFNGESQKENIYGLNTSGKFQAASSNASFAAFRMFVGTTESVFPLNAPRRAPGEYVDEYEIGILDEDGNDITDQIMNGSNITGVEDVADLSFGIYGGQGVITITSDADYGTVPVYSLDGKVVATADVVAGTTTTVNLQNGVYIVLGKKVLVK